MRGVITPIYLVWVSESWNVSSYPQFVDKYHTAFWANAYCSTFWPLSPNIKLRSIFRHCIKSPHGLRSKTIWGEKRLLRQVLTEELFCNSMWKRVVCRGLSVRRPIVMMKFPMNWSKITLMNKPGKLLLESRCPDDLHCLPRTIIDCIR